MGADKSPTAQAWGRVSACLGVDRVQIALSGDQEVPGSPRYS